MADAAAGFVASLTPDQRQKAVFPFESAERVHWNFIPTEAFPRNGLTLKEMTEAQRQRARDLLKAGLSQRGYLTATAIMDLETTLGALEQRAQAAGGRGEGMRRDPVRATSSPSSGRSSAKSTWGWRGSANHAYQLHFDVVNGTLVASSPSFFGSNPAEVREGPKKGLRILADQEDTARALLTALDEKQRAKAIIQHRGTRTRS